MQSNAPPARSQLLAGRSRVKRTIRFGGFFRCPDAFPVPRDFDVRPEIVLQIGLGCIQGKHVVTAPIFYRQWDASPGALHIRGHCPVAQINRVGQRPMAVNSFRFAIHRLLAEEKFRTRGKYLYEMRGECPGVSSRERRSTLSIDSDYGASEPVGPVRGKARQYLAGLCWTDRVELEGKGIVARTTVSAKNTFFCGEGSKAKHECAFDLDGTGGKRKPVGAS